jgi:hypothetical protein
MFIKCNIIVGMMLHLITYKAHKSIALKRNELFFWRTDITWFGTVRLKSGSLKIRCAYCMKSFKNLRKTQLWLYFSRKLLKPALFYFLKLLNDEISRGNMVNVDFQSSIFHFFFLLLED